ncbi:EamA family transporter [Oceanospirillum sediminis]|uniref:EamA family transporter n=1 Tax=Oceanospirillum sediminis TaxID=2760088 RepID=A0A839ILL3_9GAMM|nr:EamA family transporter [Oceanospirillum sediminis]MBB1486105.1 EamA family transporter [Oceanospirillum sediminis]
MRLNDLLLAIAVMCLWGFNFSVIKLGADQINPILLTALRFAMAVFPAIFFIARPQVKLRYLVAYGITFGVGVWGMMTWSITLGISAGMAGLLMQMSLVFSLLLGWLVLKEKISYRKTAGAILAVAGLSVSLTLQDGSVPLMGLILVMAGAISWSLISLIVKLAGTDQIFSFSVWGMLFAPIPLVVLAYISHGSEVFIQLPEQLNGTVWFSILFQAWPTTLLGYWLWNRLIVKYPLSTVAPLTTLVPVFGLIGSVIFYGETISQTKWLACILILSGLLVSQWQNQWLSFRPTTRGTDKAVNEP